MGINIYTSAQIDKIRFAGHLAAELLDMITRHVKPGVTTEELDSICYNHITNVQKAIPALLHYNGYPKTICTSINHQVCHGIPSTKKLKTGDVLNIDVTIRKNGYHGDSSRMYFVGKPSILAERLVRITHECLMIGIEQAKPGNRLGDIGYAIQEHAHKHRFSTVRELCGHGIGKVIHEDPNVLHFGQPETGIIIEPGMVFTIEPMVNAGKRHIRTLSDGWTVVTKDRSLSAQWEHTMAITNSGCEILTNID